jgi:hypothetical protein
MCHVLVAAFLHIIKHGAVTPYIMAWFAGRLRPAVFQFTVVPTLLTTPPGDWNRRTVVYLQELEQENYVQPN